MREDQVYVLAKRGLQATGWTLLGGQPPRGTDHLPVIEIKDPFRIGKGSIGAYKPDLVAWREPSFLLIVECKPWHDDPDAQKLRLILADQARSRELWQEIEQRGLFRRAGLNAMPHHRVQLLGALAHSTVGAPPMDDLGVIVCRRSSPVTWLPAASWPHHLSLALTRP